MSQLTIFTGKRQTGQTTRLAEAIIEQAKICKVICYAANPAAARALFAILQLKLGVDDNTEIPNISVFNCAHDDFFKRNEGVDFSNYKNTEVHSDHPTCMAFDDVPLDRLAWLTEWSANTNVRVLAAYSSDAEFKASL